MTLSEILQDIEAFFSAQWSTTTIAWPNIPFTAPSGSWVSFHNLPDETTAEEIGPDGVGIRRGVVKIQVFTLPNIGSRTGAGLADTIEALFYKADVGSVNFDAAYITDNGLMGDKTWYQHTITAPWWAWVNE